MNTSLQGMICDHLYNTYVLGTNGHTSICIWPSRPSSLFVLSISMYFSFVKLSKDALISLSFSAHNPFFSLNSSDFAPARIGSVPLVTHLKFSFLHHAIHSFRRSPPSHGFSPAIANICVVFVHGLPYFLDFLEEYLPFYLESLAITPNHAFGCAAVCYLEYFLNVIVLYILYSVYLLLG